MATTLRERRNLLLDSGQSAALMTAVATAAVQAVEEGQVSALQALCTKFLP